MLKIENSHFSCYYFFSGISCRCIIGSWCCSRCLSLPRLVRVKGSPLLPLTASSLRSDAIKGKRGSPRGLPTGSRAVPALENLTRRLSPCTPFLAITSFLPLVQKRIFYNNGCCFLLLKKSTFCNNNRYFIFKVPSFFREKEDFLCRALLRKLTFLEKTK